MEIFYLSIRAGADPLFIGGIQFCLLPSFLAPITPALFFLPFICPSITFFSNESWRNACRPNHFSFWRTIKNNKLTAKLWLPSPVTLTEITKQREKYLYNLVWSTANWPQRLRSATVRVDCNCRSRPSYELEREPALPCSPAVHSFYVAGRTRLSINQSINQHTILTCAQKQTSSQLSLSHGIVN